jgi:histone acetyltransferase (RNA polymerase elongator complex component)
MAKAEEILNKFPKKMLIGIIISLAGAIGTGGYFVYQKYIDVDYQSQIDSLKYQNFILSNKVISLDSRIERNKNLYLENENKLKAYIDKGDKFVLENADAKNKSIALQFLELKQVEPQMYEPKIYRDTVIIKETTYKTDTIKEVIIQKDTIKKKGFFKSLIN